MKPVVLLVFFSLPLLAISGCSVSKYQFGEASYREASVNGETQEALTSYEAQAQEAEKNAQASLFPQQYRQYWQAAVDAYRLAGRAAREAGQLQKAITYGEKAVEMAEKSKNPASLVPAINQLSYTYSELRNFDKARELIEKAIAIVKGLPPNNHVRVYFEGLLYGRLGNNLIREREYEKAIDLFSLAVYYEQGYAASVRRNPVELNVARGNVVSVITSLGNAYRRAGQLQDSVEQ
jgi:tetratricopeptide (TPR) repeat protein